MKETKITILIWIKFPFYFNIVWEVVVRELRLKILCTKIVN